MVLVNPVSISVGYYIYIVFYSDRLYVLSCFTLKTSDGITIYVKVEDVSRASEPNT